MPHPRIGFELQRPLATPCPSSRSKYLSPKSARSEGVAMMPPIREATILNGLTVKHPEPLIDLEFSSQAALHRVLWLLSWDWQLPSFEELGIDDECAIYEDDST